MSFLIWKYLESAYYFLAMMSSPEKTDKPDSESNIKKLSCGCLLLARDELRDPNFDSTAVLICVHSTEGTYGLVLNRFSHMPLSEIFDGFQGLDLRREIFIGGPVKQEEVQLVQVTDTPVEGAFEIYPGVFMGGKWESIGQMIETDPLTTRLFLGYSGWGPGQLEAEIRAGAWEVYKADLVKLLSDTDRKIYCDKSALTKYILTLQKDDLKITPS
jgi:putative transcriptional regulator